jgi:type IV secretory pathway VirB6-like protein
MRYSSLLNSSSKFTRYFFLKKCLVFVCLYTLLPSALYSANVPVSAPQTAANAAVAAAANAQQIAQQARAEQARAEQAANNIIAAAQGAARRAQIDALVLEGRARVARNEAITAAQNAATAPAQLQAQAQAEAAEKAAIASSLEASLAQQRATVAQANQQLETIRNSPAAIAAQAAATQAAQIATQRAAEARSAQIAAQQALAQVDPVDLAQQRAAEALAAQRAAEALVAEREAALNAAKARVAQLTAENQQAQALAEATGTDQDIAAAAAKSAELRAAQNAERTAQTQLNQAQLNSRQQQRNAEYLAARVPIAAAEAERESERAAQIAARVAPAAGASGLPQNATVDTTCPDDGKLFARIVHCLEEKLFESTYYFINNLYPRYRTTVFAAMSLAVAFLGMMLATGGVQSTAKDTLTLLLKMVAVIYIMDNVIPIYIEFVEVLSSLVTEVASAGQSLFGNNLRCPAGNVQISFSGLGLVTTPVWERVDCIFDSVIGISADAALSGTGGAAGGGSSDNPDLTRGMMGFFYHNLKSGALGLLIGLAGLYIAFNLLLALFKASYTYLVAVALMSLMFVVGIIFLPAFLFSGTFSYFEKWYKVVLSMVLQPIILFTYLNIMMIAFDIMLFSGDNSVEKLVCANAGASGTQSIDRCAEEGGYYIEDSISFAREYDPSDIPVVPSDQDMGSLGNVQVTQLDVDFTNPSTVPIGFDFIKINYGKNAGQLDPAQLAAATLLAALCSYIFIMFMNAMPRMATELAGGVRTAPTIISGDGAEVTMPGTRQLDGIASGQAFTSMAGNTTRQIGNMVGRR